jgi:hypothetical protein
MPVSKLLLISEVYPASEFVIQNYKKKLLPEWKQLL